MKPGDVVRVKVKETGEKVSALVTDVRAETEMLDVTLGPDAVRLGLEPDVSRQFMPGRTQRTITLVVLGP